MSFKRVVTLSTTTSYQNVDTLLDALSSGPLRVGRTFFDGTFKCPSDAADPVRVSIVDVGSSTGSDTFSVLLNPGEYLAFEEVDLKEVWVKSVAAASTLEIEGTLGTSLSGRRVV